MPLPMRNNQNLRENVQPSHGSYNVFRQIIVNDTKTQERMAPNRWPPTSLAQAAGLLLFPVRNLRKCQKAKQPVWLV